MDVMELLKTLSSAVADAQAAEKAQQAAHSKMSATIAAAKAQFDAVESAARAEFQQANQTYQDAKVAVERLKGQANESLGGLFAAGDSRVRQG